MTAKEALRNYIEGLSEDDAADLLLWIESREQSMSFSEDEYDRIAAGNADVREGRLHDHAETLAEARALYGR